MTEYGYDSLPVGDRDKEPELYGYEEAEESSWPEILSPDEADGVHLIRLLQDYRWANWLLMELTALTASEYDERRDLLDPEFRCGVLLNGEPGNGRSAIARAIIRSLGRAWISLNRTDWQEKLEKEFLSGMMRCLKENMGRKLCLLVEDLSCCRYADALTEMLSDYTDRVEPQDFFLIILEDEWKIPEYLQEKLLVCTFRNPDEKEREDYLKRNLREPPLVLAPEERKMILEQTEGFSYTDMGRLIHWLRILQRDIFLKKYEDIERDEMSDAEYSSAFGRCELGTKNIESLLGLLRKDRPSERAAVPMVMVQNPVVQTNPVPQLNPQSAAELVQMPEADRMKKKEESISAFINGKSVEEQIQLFEKKHQAISGGTGK